MVSPGRRAQRFAAKCYASAPKLLPGRTVGVSRTCPARGPVVRSIRTGERLVRERVGQALGATGQQRACDLQPGAHARLFSR